ncbi:MAG: precorrin-3B synthase, partial [Hyphomicrobium sp.]
MESGDGLIVRLRAHAGTLSGDDLLAIAGIAQRFGNGLIDLTRRANVQIRGVTQDKLAGLWSDLSMLGLLDPSSDAEAVRNVMVNPLAGVDPTEICDVRSLARELEHRLAEDQALWQL